jgi:hypothetical protein
VLFEVLNDAFIAVALLGTERGATTSTAAPRPEHGELNRVMPVGSEEG